MDTSTEALRVELEAGDGTPWWTGLLATLAAQYGNGWVQVGRGERPWSVRYVRQERPARAASSK